MCTYHITSPAMVQRAQQLPLIAWDPGVVEGRVTGPFGDDESANHGFSDQRGDKEEKRKAHDDGAITTWKRYIDVGDAQR